MLKLIKYEFRKNRSILLAIAGILALLQGYFLYSLFMKKDSSDIAVSLVLLLLLAWACFFMIFILAITNYSRELNSKSSYLIFMTPNSSYTIIFSKMLTTLLQGILLLAAGSFLGWLDITLGHMVYPELEDFSTLFEQFLLSVGIPVLELLLNLLTGALAFLILFFATISTIYLAVTLSTTFLQNSKLKHVISVILFLAINWISTKIMNLLPVLIENPQSMTESLFAILPIILFNLAVLVTCTWLSGFLLEKKVSL